MVTVFFCPFPGLHTAKKLFLSKEGPGLVELREITNANIWKVCTLEPFEEQKDFVAENGELCGNEIVAVYEL